MKQEGKIVIDMNDIQGSPWVLTSVLRRELTMHSGKTDEYVDELFAPLDWKKDSEIDNYLIYIFLNELGDTYMLDNLTDEQVKYVKEKK